MAKVGLNLKYFNVEQNFNRNLKRNKYPMSFFPELFIFVISNSFELLLYGLYMYSHLLYPVLWKMIVIILLWYIYIIFKFYEVTKIFEYVRVSNMVKTLIQNEDSEEYEEVDSLYINDNGKIIIEKIKDKNIINLKKAKEKLRKLSKKNKKERKKTRKEIRDFYNSVASIEKSYVEVTPKDFKYLVTYKRTPETPTLHLAVVPFSLVVLCIFTLLSINSFDLLGKHPIRTMTTVLLILITVTFCLTKKLEKKTQIAELNNGELDIN